MTPTLLAEAFLALATAVLYLYVGALIRRRSLPSEGAQQANRAFATWWFALSGYTTLTALRDALAGIGILDRGVHAGLLYLGLGALATALWGLLSYLVYIYVGHTRWRVALLVAHIGLGVGLFMLFVWMHPLRVVPEDWVARIEYEHALEGPLLALVLVSLLGPVLVAATAYLTLAFRVRDPTSRRRILLVSGAFLFWFGASALANSLGWNHWYWWPLVSRGIALAATLVILYAYRSRRPAWQPDEPALPTTDEEPEEKPRARLARAASTTQ